MRRSNPFAALAESDSDSDTPAAQQAPTATSTMSSSSSSAPAAPQPAAAKITFHRDGGKDETPGPEDNEVAHDENKMDDLASVPAEIREKHDSRSQDGEDVKPAEDSRSQDGEDEKERRARRKRACPEKSESKDGVRWDILVAVDKDVNVAAVGKVVEVTYSGYLPSKQMKRFDAGEISWMVGSGGMITGFDIGVRGMREGERRRIYIPAKLGYGKKGHKPKIPPNADLVFDVLLRSAGIDWDSKQTSGMSKNRREEAKRRAKKPRRS
eukprot:GEMP01057196.1.p1 GENE.GEMP01057196.1~~GEMP01057196.1.p1  ORF type:complete len:268 (+),score=75.08 GEMP01057196.1:156-959(+)